MIERSKYDAFYVIQEIHIGFMDSDWTKVFAFKKNHSERAGKFTEYDSIHKLKKKYISYLNAGFKLFLVWKDDREFGLIFFYNKKKFGHKVVFMKDNFLLSNLDQMLFTIILKQFFNSFSTSQYLVLTSNNSSNNYIEKLLHLEISEIRELFELEINQVSDNLISKWINSGLKNDDEFEIILMNEIPNGLIEDYLELTNELHDDITYKSCLFDETFLSAKRLRNFYDHYKEKGITHIALLLFEKHGRILAGYTEINIDSNLPHVATQNMTGIRSKFRGKGLAKFLKANMFKILKERFPKVTVIKTAIHAKNTPSQKLNRQMGFRKSGIYKEYIIPRESIVEYLNKIKTSHNNA